MNRNLYYSKHFSYILIVSLILLFFISLGLEAHALFGSKTKINLPSVKVRFSKDVNVETSEPGVFERVQRAITGDDFRPEIKLWEAVDYKEWNGYYMGLYTEHWIIYTVIGVYQSQEGVYLFDFPQFKIGKRFYLDKLEISGGLGCYGGFTFSETKDYAKVVAPMSKLPVLNISQCGATTTELYEDHYPLRDSILHFTSRYSEYEGGVFGITEDELIRVVDEILSGLKFEHNFLGKVAIRKEGELTEFDGNIRVTVRPNRLFNYKVDSLIFEMTPQKEFQLSVDDVGKTLGELARSFSTEKSSGVLNTGEIAPESKLTLVYWGGRVGIHISSNKNLNPPVIPELEERSNYPLYITGVSDFENPPGPHFPFLPKDRLYREIFSRPVE